MFKRLVGLSALAVVAACDDQVQVESPHSVHTDVRAIATQARGAGDILLIVGGADTVGSPGPVMNAVRTAIQGRPGSVNPSYTLDAAAAGQETSVVRVVLNGPKAMKTSDICRGEGGRVQSGR